MRKGYPTDLSDAEWEYIEPHLPVPKGFGQPRVHDLREILNAVFYLLKSGCQWRLLVDTEGFVLKAHVHSAKVMDYEGIKTLLLRANEWFPRLRYLWLDAGYRGEDKGADWVRKALGWTVDLVERPKKPAPDKVMMAWAREWAKEGVAVCARPDRTVPTLGRKSSRRRARKPIHVHADPSHEALRPRPVLRPRLV